MAKRPRVSTELVFETYNKCNYDEKEVARTLDVSVRAVKYHLSKRRSIARISSIKDAQLFSDYIALKQKPKPKIGDKVKLGKLIGEVEKLYPFFFSVLIRYKAEENGYRRKAVYYNDNWIKVGNL